MGFGEYCWRRHAGRFGHSPGPGLLRGVLHPPVGPQFQPVRGRGGGDQPADFAAVAIALCRHRQSSHRRAAHPPTQLATLAYYYLLADPASTFLNCYGGYEPSTTWPRHWTAAAAYDVGQPLGTWSVFATGQDPANVALTYKIYQRSYGNALVLYKPLSKGNNVNGTLADATATTHALNGTYRPLRADGTLGAPVPSLTPRNDEAAILIKS